MTTKFSAQLRRITTVSALGLTLVALPTFITTAEAKPPKHAPAWGYRAKQDNKRDWKDRDRDRDRDRDDWRDRDRDDWRRRSSSNNSWSKKTWSKPSSSRRYRIRYRTAYNRYGRPYKVAYRAYY